MWYRQEQNSVFYIDSDYDSFSASDNMMESEVRSLKQELERTREALKLATKRCRDLVRELDHRTAGQEAERSLRDQQLARILRALLVVEGRLKQEQKSIRQLLCEKDNVIRNQQLEIAKLRRYTKNYIKCKRDNTVCKDVLDRDESSEIMSNDRHSISSKSDGGRFDSCLSKDIRTLKCEIITKLNEDSDQDHGLRKAHSFAESDVSKTSITSSEITDVSMTTTDSSPSILSTEGFCEGESTDVSPSSTLNKSTRCNSIAVADDLLSSDNEVNADDRLEIPKRNIEAIREKLLTESEMSELKGNGVTRTESKDDGMDCHFISDEEPVYENATYPDKELNKSTELTKNNINNGSDSVEAVRTIEPSLEENSGNWYSDPDEDKASEEVFRHRAYQPNSKHNSVLECVNQILLRDMEEEENVLSVPRRFKHRGRIVRFQPARLSDIESVGSEMERRSSEDHALDRDGLQVEERNEINASGVASPASERDFRGRSVQPIDESARETMADVLSPSNVNFEGSKAIPLVIIEPKVDPEASGDTPIASPQKLKSCADLMKSSLIHTSSPPLKMERIEEKTCLQMCSKGLTIAKNLDYEEIESLPETSSGLKTPPTLPPKPQYKNNTLILKKIPSPSFLINETHKKQGGGDSTPEHDKKLFNFSLTPKVETVRSLSYDEKSSKSSRINNNELQNGFYHKNKFNSLRSSFQSKQNLNNVYDGVGRMPKVTNIVRHFEEFKIGEAEDRTLVKDKDKDKEKSHLDYDQDDIRQNFEEFNLDDCDLFDDPDRPEADGSERLNDLILATQIETTAKGKEANTNCGYDHFLEATGLSTKSILTPSRLLSNHKSMLKPKDVKYKNKIKATAVMERHGMAGMSSTHTHVKHWTGPFV
ncbi:uncharacterized protein LOC124178152 isoform X1 [Neodiprion fabricii]|uniref:uncharacterized protein LOC124178152 isoform X1 n=3 Tax=Neodiprion fabricii TaxID=2872261 RepID=UPI001ED921C8|nr:uncharacterized protein LOC124178152 isoform X1 [Neodiprion fabricii]